MKDWKPTFFSVREIAIGAWQVVNDRVLTWSFCVSLDGIAGNGFAGSFNEQKQLSSHLQRVFESWSLAEQHDVFAASQHDSAEEFIEQQIDVAGASNEQQLAFADSFTLLEQQPQSLPFMPNGCTNSIPIANHAISCFVKSLLIRFECTIEIDSKVV